MIFTSFIMLNVYHFTTAYYFYSNTPFYKLYAKITQLILKNKLR